MPLNTEPVQILEDETLLPRILREYDDLGRSIHAPIRAR
jgi:hypothetical protein